MDNLKRKKIEKIIEEFKIASCEEINNNKHFITTKQYLYTLNNGLTLTREQVFKNNQNGDAVIIMPVLENKEILTVIEPRVFTVSGIAIGFPAGYINKNEGPINAALRELREETGYVPKDIRHLDSFYQDEGCSRAFNHAYLATNCEKKFPQDLDQDEYIKYLSFTLDELDELESLGYISGANSKLTLARGRKYLSK